MTLSSRPFRTTVLGGSVFMLVLALLGQAPALVAAGCTPIAARLPVEHPASVAIVSVVAISLPMPVCFAAGPPARAAVDRTWSAAFEAQRQTLQPRNAVIEWMTHGPLDSKVGMQGRSRRCPPATTTFGSRTRSSAATIAKCSCSRPADPKAWTGCVVSLGADRVVALDVDRPASTGRWPASATAWARRCGRRPRPGLGRA